MEDIEIQGTIDALIELLDYKITSNLDELTEQPIGDCKSVVQQIQNDLSELKLVNLHLLFNAILQHINRTNDESFLNIIGILTYFLNGCVKCIYHFFKSRSFDQDIIIFKIENLYKESNQDFKEELDDSFKGYFKSLRDDRFDCYNSFKTAERKLLEQIDNI